MSSRKYSNKPQHKHKFGQGGGKRGGKNREAA